MGTGVRHKTRGHGRVTAFDEASHHPYEVTFDNGEVRSRLAAGGGLTPDCMRARHWIPSPGGGARRCISTLPNLHTSWTWTLSGKLDAAGAKPCTDVALWHFVPAALLRRLC